MAKMILFHVRKIFFSLVFLSFGNIYPSLVAQQKPYLQLDGPTYIGGMFSVFCSVAGFLKYYEAEKDLYSGVKFDFGDRGVYYDPIYGLNWWEYYCEPVCIGHYDPLTQPLYHIGNDDCVRFASDIEFRTTKEQVHYIIQKYIRVKPHITEKLNHFILHHFNADRILGIHYRGTDKSAEAPRVPFEKVFEEVDKYIQTLTPNSTYRIFVATDEQQFLDAMQRQYPQKVIAYEAFRSSNGDALHYHNQDPYHQGEEALLDCLLLSKCHFLIRTTSNLSLWSTYFNPTLPVVMLNERSHYF